MSFRQRIRDSIDSIWIVLKYHEDNTYNLRRDIREQIISLKKIYADLQERTVWLMQDQDRKTIKINELKNQITDLKQEICGLKTGHKFEYRGDIGPQHIFICKLCGYLVLKVENQLTPVERKALITLGILNEPAKRSN